jgi:hypothetical protein
MAVKKSKGIITNHIQRQHAGRDIKPCKWFRNGSGSGIMVAQYKDTGDMVMDEQGKPVHWNHA